MKYFWTAEPEKNFRNRFSGTWKITIPSNGFKVNRDNYKAILTDPDAIDVTEEFFNYHTKAYQCIVTYWVKIDIDGHPGYINPNNKSQMNKYLSNIVDDEMVVIEDLDKSLDEKIEKHDTLNPLLWNEDGTLKEEVHDKIIEITNDFIDNLKQDGIKFDLKDIRIVGSNCSYNYTKDSDLDVHLIAGSSSLNCPDELYPLLYSSYRSIYNKNLNIDFYGIPVEIYVEVE